MKKTFYLLTFAVVGIITVITIAQFNNGLLNENIAALAWDQGGASVVRCIEDGPTCYHTLIICDDNGKPLRDQEGNPLTFTERIDGLKNQKPEAQ